MPKKLTRRTFLASTSAAAAALSGATASRLHAAEDAKPAPPPGTFQQSARDVPIVEEADVVVCGGGPAGVSAAIAAARAGAKTRLIDVGGCLGGIWTAGLLSWIIDWQNKPGLMQEYVERLDRRGYYKLYGSSAAYDPEQMKLVLEQMCIEAGVRVRLHTRVVDAAVDDAGRVKLAVTESKSGREAFAGRVFVDCTGDGDLAARCGCGFDIGRGDVSEKGSDPLGDEHQCQPMTLIALVAGLDPEEVYPYVRGLAEPRGEKNPKGRLREAMQRGGHDPSYTVPVLFYLREGLYCLGANHEFGVSALNAQEITDATIRARAEVHRLVDGLRSLGGEWRNLQIVATAEHIGVREGRRVHGLYEVSTKDILEGARHEDAVCRTTFCIDVHSLDPKHSKGIEGGHGRVQPYDVPFRSLVAKDVQGLLLAGRNISGDFLAHSSYRVTGNSVAMGEAAGTAAAIAAKTNRLPQDVPWAEIAGAIDRVRGKAAG